MCLAKLFMMSSLILIEGFVSHKRLEVEKEHRRLRDRKLFDIDLKSCSLKNIKSQEAQVSGWF